MKTAAAAVVWLCGCFMSPVVHFGAGKSPEEAQHDTLAKLMPPALDTEGTWHGAVRPVDVRVWADDDYRAQNVQWQRTFGEQLDYANAVLGPMLGIRLVPQYRTWQHHAPGVALSDQLPALAAEDPGDGAFAVIGLTSSLSLVSATFDQLGVASLPGRYIIVRGYADVEERKAFERAFHSLGREERESVLQARRQHKTTGVLLHELGHNLGAPHEPDPDTLMNAIYSDHAASFSTGSRELMLASVDARLGRSIELQPQPAAVRHPTLMISVSAAGDAMIGGQRVDGDTLDELLRSSFANDPETVVAVRPAPSAPHNAVIEVLDRAKRAGLQHMAVDAGH